MDLLKCQCASFHGVQFLSQSFTATSYRGDTGYCGPSGHGDTGQWTPEESYFYDFNFTHDLAAIHSNSQKRMRRLARDNQGQ